MNDHAKPDTYGELSDDGTLTIQRLLPGPVDRVWSYLTESDLRRKWLASGEMDLKAGAPFELTWRNDELTDPPGDRPDGFSEEHSMESRIVEVDPPRKLVFEWNGSGDVSIELEPRGDRVLLTLVHRRIADRNTRLMIGAGWHTHLDVLVALVMDSEPDPFWDTWTRLKADYDRRVPA